MNLDDAAEPQILDFIDHLILATEDDEVFIRCSGYGGCHDYAVMILNNIIACKAPVTIIADGNCSSSHANIALSKHIEDLVIGKVGVYFLLHDFQIDLNTDGSHNLYNTVSFYKDKSKKFYEDNGIFDLLTKEELQRFYDNKDIIIHSEDIGRRLVIRDINSVCNITEGVRQHGTKKKVKGKKKTEKK